MFAIGSSPYPAAAATEGRSTCCTGEQDPSRAFIAAPVRMTPSLSTNPSIDPAMIQSATMDTLYYIYAGTVYIVLAVLRLLFPTTIRRFLNNPAIVADDGFIHD